MDEVSPDRQEGFAKYCKGWLVKAWLDLVYASFKKHRGHITRRERVCVREKGRKDPHHTDITEREGGGGREGERNPDDRNGQNRGKGKTERKALVCIEPIMGPTQNSPISKAPNKGKVVNSAEKVKGGNKDWKD
jgi:hypothetical protein